MLKGCEHFSFCSLGVCAGDCSLTNISAKKTLASSWLSGPPACPFDCSYDDTQGRPRATRKSPWSDAKTKWCSDNNPMSTTSRSPASPFVCIFPYGSIPKDWNDDKWDWCCRHGRCPTTTTTSGTIVTTTNQFDCEHNKDNFQVE